MAVKLSKSTRDQIICPRLFLTPTVELLIPLLLTYTMLTVLYYLLLHNVYYLLPLFN